MPESRLDYVSAVDLKKWESGELIYEDIIFVFIRLSEDVCDPLISEGEKRKALKTLWKALQEFESAGYGGFFLPNPSYPSSHWWWHPELWDDNLDIYGVLEDTK